MLPLSYGAVLLWMAVAYQLIASSNAQNNAPGYLGCFEDNFLRSLRGDSTNSNSMSVEWCFNYCLTIKAYKYAGVESERECHCVDNEDYGRLGTAADSECRYTCPGNSNQFCGGRWRLAMYRISSGVCNNAIGPPDHGTREVTNPTHVSFELDNVKFFGTRVRFECETGYILQGAETIECTQSGNIATWDDSVPSCTATSLLPTTVNQTDTMDQTGTSTTAYNTNVIISGAPSVSPDATDGPVMSDTQTSQTGTIVGTVAGVIAAVILLLVIVIIIFRRRGNKREERTDVAIRTVNLTVKDPDVTSESTYEIPRRPGMVKQNPKECDVPTYSTYEIPSPTGAIIQNTNEYDVTTSVMLAYEIPRPPTNKNHQFTREQSSNDIVHEYADFKLSSPIKN